MANANPRIAAIHFAAGFPIDDFLNEIAASLRVGGVRLAGAVQENLSGPAGPCAAMVLTDIGSRRRFQISQDLGRQAEGCRLDAAGLAEIGALLDCSMSSEIELLLLNRFGKAEAEGHGLRSAFLHAIEAGVPILTAVRPPYNEAWADFHGGLAAALPPSRDAVLSWALESVRLARAARQAERSPAATV